MTKETSSFLEVNEGVPEGSVLGSILFFIYVNNFLNNAFKNRYHSYADDTIIYCCSTWLGQGFEFLQDAFYVFQSLLYDLKLVLNTDKTKLMFFLI